MFFSLFVPYIFHSCFYCLHLSRKKLTQAKVVQNCLANLLSCETQLLLRVSFRKAKRANERTNEIRVVSYWEHFDCFLIEIKVDLSKRRILNDIRLYCS